jgi:hypothetical protein
MLSRLLTKLLFISHKSEKYNLFPIVDRRNRPILIEKSVYKTGFIPTRFSITKTNGAVPQIFSHNKTEKPPFLKNLDTL